jgi:hypothetical protein
MVWLRSHGHRPIALALVQPFGVALVLLEPGRRRLQRNVKPQEARR